MKRNFGLDILRASAILIVIFDHAWYFDPRSKTLPNLFSACGFIGVELFFVLSGFLIGQIVLKNLSQNMSFKSLSAFYIRRWFRTLPVYYLVLVGLIISSNIIYRTLELHLYHFVFLQNFVSTEFEFFGPAWSLAVEEWFYLLLPVLFIPLFTTSRSKYSLKIIILAIAGTLVARALVVASQGLSFEEVRRFIPLRFDSLLLGVVLAGLKLQHEKMYKRLQSIQLFLISTIVLVGIAWYYNFLYLSHRVDNSNLLKIAGFSLISLCVAGMIPFLENNSFINVTLRNNKHIYWFFSTVSIISYSLYLVHLQIFILIIKFFSTSFPSWILFIVALFCAFTAAFILYHFYEKPFMQLRDRLTTGG